MRLWAWQETGVSHSLLGFCVSDLLPSQPGSYTGLLCEVAKMAPMTKS